MKLGLKKPYGLGCQVSNYQDQSVGQLIDGQNCQTGQINVTARSGLPQNIQRKTTLLPSMHSERDRSASCLHSRQVHKSGPQFFQSNQLSHYIGHNEYSDSYLQDSVSIGSDTVRSSKSSSALSTGRSNTREQDFSFRKNGQLNPQFNQGLRTLRQRRIKTQFSQEMMPLHHSSSTVHNEQKYPFYSRSSVPVFSNMPKKLNPSPLYSTVFISPEAGNSHESMRFMSTRLRSKAAVGRSQIGTQTFYAQSLKFKCTGILELYEQKIYQLQKQLKTLELRNSQLQTALKQLTDENKYLSAQNSDLHSSLRLTKEELSTLQTKIDNTENGHLLLGHGPEQKLALIKSAHLEAIKEDLAILRDKAYLLAPDTKRPQFSPIESRTSEVEARVSQELAMLLANMGADMSTQRGRGLKRQKINRSVTKKSHNFQDGGANRYNSRKIYD